MKLRKREMKKLSENLNDVFGVLNELTGSKVFQSTVFDLDDGEGPLLHIKVCGRDSVWTDKLEVVDRGMSPQNEFVKVLKVVNKLKSPKVYESTIKEFMGEFGEIIQVKSPISSPSNPLYGPVLNYESQPVPKTSKDVEWLVKENYFV